MKSRALLAFTASAMAIPPVHAASPPTKVDVDAQYHSYRERDLAEDKSGSPERSRYSIDSLVFHLAGPQSSGGMALDLTLETMSGASPWFVTPGANGPVQVMSGASIRETRVAGSGRYDFYGPERRTGLQLGFSKEKDYKSLSVGVDRSLEYNQNNTILNGGAGVSIDRLNPTEGGSARFPERIRDASKSTSSVFAGVEQVVSADTALQFSANYTYESGYLSDPYKLAFVGGSTVPDARPRQRQQFSMLARLRHYFAKAKAALHLDYRYFHDDWGVVSDTLELAWHQSLGDWQVMPAARWYSQTQADFYGPYYNQASADGLYSSDYRLSPFGALSLSLLAARETRNWKISARYEYYDSGARYAASHVDIENPGLVDFDVLSVTLRRVF